LLLKWLLVVFLELGRSWHVWRFLGLIVIIVVDFVLYNFFTLLFFL